jgi:AcrR family transcriptional regulator
MPKLNPQEMERRRGRIVAAARLCFSRDGFSDCSMDDICEQAGLSKGAVYNHFSSKEELIYAVADDQGRSLKRLTEGKSLEEMRDSLLDIFAYPTDGPDARLEFHAMSRAFTDEGLRLRMRRNAALVEEALEHALARLEASGQVRLPAGRERTSEILLVFLHGIFTRQLLADDSRVREDFDLLLDLVMEKTAE